MGRYDGPHLETEDEHVVSVWVATVPFVDIPKDYWLPDYDGEDDAPWNQFSHDFGFGSYDTDFVESYFHEPDGNVVPVEDLIKPLSYASSFVDAVVQRASEIGVAKTSYVYLVYNFKYDESVTGRHKSDCLRFVGVFPYDDTAT